MKFIHIITIWLEAGSVARRRVKRTGWSADPPEGLSFMVQNRLLVSHSLWSGKAIKQLFLWFCCCSICDGVPDLFMTLPDRIGLAVNSLCGKCIDCSASAVFVNEFSQNRFICNKEFIDNTSSSTTILFYTLEAALGSKRHFGRRLVINKTILPPSISWELDICTHYRLLFWSIEWKQCVSQCNRYLSLIHSFTECSFWLLFVSIAFPAFVLLFEAQQWLWRCSLSDTACNQYGHCVAHFAKMVIVFG